MKTVRLLSLLLVPLCSLFASPTTAEACGGTFCDAGPQVMPVDQTGENVVFVMKEGTVEAHIQIAYTGDPDRFAWVIPVNAVPEFEAGSQQFFSSLLAGSVVQYGWDATVECDGAQAPAGSFGCGLGASDASFAGDGGVAEEYDEEETDSGGADVILRDMVGAFEVVVLQAGTSDELFGWLDAHGYQQDDDAPPIVQQYLDEDFFFVAVKLRPGAGVDEIHPLVMRYAGNEPCVPIRLTRIAAVEDMAIRVFFLGDNRVAPQNYRHVLVNPLKIDWVQFGQNYVEAVTMAADAPVADGHAFVTEYAGPSDVVTTANLWDLRWNADVFVTMDPVDVVDELTEQGVMGCSAGQCVYLQPLVRGILTQYIPVPEGVAEGDFYRCLSCYEDDIDVLAWNGDLFSQAYDERVVQPGFHARDLVNENPYLTRMFTTISPAEMTVDPIFHESPDLPDVDNVRMGELRIRCGADAFELPDGRTVVLEADGSWPDFADEMPWVEEVQQATPAGAPLVEVRNTETIDELLEVHNLDRLADSDEDADAELEDELTGGGGGGSGCGCRLRGIALDGPACLVVIFGAAWHFRGRRRRPC